VYKPRLNALRLKWTKFMNTTEKIAFQGELGAYSHQACNQFEPNMEAFPCKTFEDAIEDVSTINFEIYGTIDEPNIKRLN